MNNRILSLLGLALRGGRLAVGEEPAALAAKAGQARLLVVASDAADNTFRRAEHLAQQGHCLWLTLPFSKAELGGALGRGSAAVAALTDLGLASAVAERLAAEDPERYREIAARMDLKRRRAKERQSAPHRPPPPKEDRRPPRPRREGGGPSSWRDRRDSRHFPEREESNRPHGEKPRRGPARPHDGKPGQGRGGKPERPHGGKPASFGGGTRSPSGKGRPSKGRGNPRSGGGQRGRGH